MFKKPLSQIKSFSPLRSSDRRRFQNDAYNAYPSLKDKCSQEGASPLMPDPLLSAKFTTSNNVNGVVHVANNKPLWLKLEGFPPIPTVYTLWEHPEALPMFYTVGPVIQKLIDGADLMIPGVFPSPDGTIPAVEKGDLVAITVRGYSYPLAVGTMALASKDIKVRSGMKGKAIHLIHVYHDALWAMGDKSDPPEMKALSDDEYEEEDEDAHQPKDDQGDLADNVEAQLNIQDANDNQESSQQEDQTPKLSASEVDEVLKEALLQALLFKMTPEKAQTLLPMSASALYTSYILPCRPRGRGSDADIKQSTWKKLQKFLKVMDKAQILKIKDQRGETMVTSVNFSHPSFQGLSPYKTIGTAPTTQSNGNQSSSADNDKKTSSSSSSSKGPIEIQELYKPQGKGIIPLFEATKHSIDEAYTSQEVRKIITEYIKASELANPRNQRMVRIDALLCDAVLKKTEYRTVDELTREQIMDRLLPQMQACHIITFPGHEPEIRKGEPKPIMVTQEVRMGRKTITKVVGLERYNIDVGEMCKELTKLCASSATHNPVPGSSPKHPVHEILVQGPQFKHVNTLLINRGVPSRMIAFDDKTKKKGKGKK